MPQFIYRAFPCLALLLGLSVSVALVADAHARNQAPHKIPVVEVVELT